MPQFGGTIEKCNVCSKTVYLAEKIVVEDKEDKKTFHKACLQCSHCKRVLSLGNYASMNGVMYCKPHFKQLFATKGNYDEGFGKDKLTSKWAPQAVSAPASFVPVDKDEKSSSPKVDSPNAVASKFGKTSLNTDKCHACTKTVYAIEKIVVEDKEDKKTFHKNCLKCTHCNVILSLGNYASMNGVIYCKPHFKQLFAAKGNYDEGFGKEKHATKWEPQAAPAGPASFVPVDKEEKPSSMTRSDSTSSAMAGRFKGSANDKCAACNKTVYLTEKIVVEDKEDKKTFHKACLKCSHCKCVLSLGNYASMNGIMYCKPHFKQLFATKGNYDEGFGKEKHTRKWQGDKDEEETSSPAPSKKESPRPTQKEEEPEPVREEEREPEPVEEAEAPHHVHHSEDEPVHVHKEGEEHEHHAGPHHHASHDDEGHHHHHDDEHDDAHEHHHEHKEGEEHEHHTGAHHHAHGDEEGHHHHHDEEKEEEEKKTDSDKEDADE